MGLVRMVRPWNEWLIVWGYDINQPAPVVDAAMATQVARQLVGDPDARDRADQRQHLDGEQHVRDPTCRRAASSSWAMPRTGTRRRTGLGPTPRSRTPSTWPGSWRRCSRGRRAPKLLDSYSAERAPDRQADRDPRQPVDRRVRADLRGARHGRRHRLRQDPGATWTRAATRRRRPRRSATALREAIAFKKYEFDCPRGRDEPALPLGRGGDGRPDRTGLRAGSGTALPADHLARRAPAACLAVRCGRARSIRRSTCAGKGQFTLFTGIGGEAWVEAAATVGARTGPRRSRSMSSARAATYRGPHRRLGARAARSADAGCVLVRPDHHVAWRSRGDWPTIRRPICARVLTRHPGALGGRR